MRGHLGKIIIYSNAQPIYFGLFGACFSWQGGNKFLKPTFKFGLEKVSVQARKSRQRKLPKLSWAGSSKFKQPPSAPYMCPAGLPGPNVLSGAGGRGGCRGLWLHHVQELALEETTSAPIWVSLIEIEHRAGGRRGPGIWPSHSQRQGGKRGPLIQSAPGGKLLSQFQRKPGSLLLFFHMIVYLENI